MLSGRARRCAVLGSPVAHSLSPVLHRAAYGELGLDWQYDAVEVTEDGLAEFVSALGPQWRGLSLTMPLKRAVFPLLDRVSATARAAGAANTVLLDDDGGREGHNTDVPGLRAALEECGVRSVPTALVVGGGATATSALLALQSMGCREVTLLVREPRRARAAVEAAERLPAAPLVRVVSMAGDTDDVPAAEVVVSTVPAAAQGVFADWLVERAPVVFDVVYDPWPTPLGEAARRAGRTVVDGLDLLVHQATRQVELMTGLGPAPLAAMRAAGERALGRDRRG